MNDRELDLLIKEKMQKYVPARPVQVLHCGVIVLVSIIIGVFNLSPEPVASNAGTGPASHGPGAWLGVLLAIAGLALYFLWTYLQIAKATREAHAELLAASPKKTGHK